MVDAISSAASTLISSSSSSSASTLDGIEAQITAKQEELANETDEQKKTAIEDEIAALKAQLEALKAAEKLKSGRAGEGEDTQAASLLSGESDKIGTRNFDESTPFGDRTAWV
ncbi:hypothetical protein ACFFP0_00015 [Rhizobium puerariae]|uniref:Uncharacterized protein n=1 Tax=Rhizobium puerariae TaxID=1585791 RepID=A0ABV6A9A5_9HYPH